MLPKPFCIVGVARHSISNDALRESLMKGLRQFATRSVDDKVANRLLECVTSVEADPSDPPSFDRLKEQSPAAARLLQLSAFFAPEPISLSLLYSDQMISSLVELDPRLKERIILGQLIIIQHWIIEELAE